MVLTAPLPYATLFALAKITFAASLATQLNNPPTVFVSDTLKTILVPGHTSPEPTLVTDITGNGFTTISTEPN